MEVTVTQLRAGAGQLIVRVLRGEAIDIISRGLKVAVLVPAEPETDTGDPENREMAV
jgi:prevent-host-death family protein